MTRLQFDGSVFELRPGTPEQERALRTLTASPTQPVWLVQRAKLLVTILDGPTVSASVTGLRAGASTRPSPNAAITRNAEPSLNDLQL